MTPTTLRDRLRREVRDAVFCACRQRLVGAPATADDWLATEVALLRAQSSGANLTDAEVAMWQRDDEEAFAHAKLVSDLVAEQLGRLLHAAPTATPSVSSPRREAAVLERAPVSIGAVPDVADLLEGMLAQERRARIAPA